MIGLCPDPFAPPSSPFQNFSHHPCSAASPVPRCSEPELSLLGVDPISRQLSAFPAHYGVSATIPGRVTLDVASLLYSKRCCQSHRSHATNSGLNPVDLSILCQASPRRYHQAVAAVVPKSLSAFQEA
ncbi:hypothetical protein M0R45_008967 [Rubus argutus]|uniref:Uncharacterized protein n=1 Tax=Rubus argutus TaxID=59490 RepID=A0AAW1Y395_RUBAR